MANHVPFSIDECGNPPFLNNFFCNFPWGNIPYETVYPGGLYRESLAEHMDETYRNFCKDSCANHVDDEVRSNRKLEQSFREFFEEVDSAVVEAGLLLEDVSRVINIYLHERRSVAQDVAIQMCQKLDSFLFPIYKILRERGYNKQDLWG